MRGAHSGLHHGAGRDQGLTIIGVHSPEFAFEKQVSNVDDAAERYGIEYPIAIDNDFETWREWDRRFWPAHYLIDEEGTVVQVHYGEGAYEDTERLIQDLLGAGKSETVQADPGNHTAGRTPETYVGYGRLEYAENPEQVAQDQVAQYEYDGTPGEDSFAYRGEWTVTDEFALTGADASLALHYYAADVHLVMAGEGTVTVTSQATGEVTEVAVDGTADRYDLVIGEPAEDVIDISFSPGIEVYAFTFG